MDAPVDFVIGHEEHDSAVVDGDLDRASFVLDFEVIVLNGVADTLLPVDTGPREEVVFVDGLDDLGC